MSGSASNFVNYKIRIDVPSHLTEAQKDDVMGIIDHLNIPHLVEELLYEKLLKYFPTDIKVEKCR